jgi:putative oxidoreductase
VTAVFIISRVLFALLFLLSAVGHLAKSAEMAQYAAYKGAPGGRAGVILSGLLLLVGAISVLFGIYGDVGALLLAVVLLGITVFMHRFWKEPDPQAKQSEQINFNKNVALIGACLAFFLLFVNAAGTLGGTLTGPIIQI